MKNIIKYLSIILLAVLGIYLRSSNLSGLTTFEWDQARDVGVMSDIIGGKPTLIGPVVRGEGSFFLGPLYYYLGSVALALGSGNPLGLAILSLILDVSVGLITYLYLAKRSRLQGILGSTIWMISPYLIKLAHVPWNVSLLSLWMITMIILWDNIDHKSWYKYLFFLVAGFSTHIHLSIVGVAGLLVLSRAKYFFSLTNKQKLLSLFFLFLPLTPLLLFDLRHGFLNTHLLISFLSGGTGHAELLIFVTTLLTKLDYTLSELLVGSRVNYLGIASLVIALSSLLVTKASSLTKLCASILVFVPFMLIIYRDLGFAEYYFLPMFIPLILLLVTRLSAQTIPKKIFISLLIAFIIVSNLNERAIITEPFSLRVKQDIASYIVGYGDIINLRLEAPPGRRDGIGYLLKTHGVSMQDEAPVIVVVTESDKIAVLLDRTDKLGEQVFGGLRVTIFGIQ